MIQLGLFILCAVVSGPEPTVRRDCDPTHPLLLRAAHVNYLLTPNSGHLPGTNHRLQLTPNKLNHIL